MLKLNAKELRTGKPDDIVKKGLKKNPIYIILDNVLDTYNVGSIFRLADAVAAKRVFLCGQTLTPPNTRIKKASVNTWQWVNWEYCQSTLDAIKKIKTEDPECRIIAVEQDARSKPYTEIKYKLPVAVIVGNETYGISKEVLKHADLIVELPMWGVNKSLNVMVSTGIVLYEIMNQ